MKVCTKCQINKPATKEFFILRNTNKSGLAAECRDCRKAYMKINNKVTDVASKHRHRKQSHKVKGVQLLGGKCTKCGINYDSTNGSIFDFHHVDASLKDFTIGNHFNKTWSLLEPEIKKCILLCSNCHRLEHSESY